jgi:hypothetical protein
MSGGCSNRNSVSTHTGHVHTEPRTGTDYGKTSSNKEVCITLQGQNNSITTGHKEVKEKRMQQE